MCDNSPPRIETLCFSFHKRVFREGESWGFPERLGDDRRFLLLLSMVSLCSWSSERAAARSLESYSEASSRLFSSCVVEVVGKCFNFQLLVQ